ncbi:hypothetical protein HZB69_00330 [Candidatus Amesbacteria bacterium]|nr:hypothetical protein [Candidatus Amesbacteria bacterium]
MNKQELIDTAKKCGFDSKKPPHDVWGKAIVNEKFKEKLLRELGVTTLAQAIQSYKES